MDSTTLWQRYWAGDEDARQRLLNDHLGLVHFVARQVARGLAVEMDFDELVSAGAVGLMNALESFDPKRGLAFSTFAAPRIRGAILDELRRQDHVPRSIRRKTREINAARDALGRELKRAPSAAETAAHMGVDLETLWRWQSDVENAVQLPLDRRAQTSDETAPTPAEVLAIDEDDSVEDRITHSQEVEILREAIMTLKDQERTVLSLYYFEELKLHEIAHILGLTESRVSQIRTKALGRLRTVMAPLRENVA
ncbi:MAG: FliA/WhiG family RNA polymerase sigma factor [Gemmatimonadaceae bacterium]|nr:FliA/WhiG family RNA polymerase sigma factor [Gemmatimonadaceae bacterium]